MEEKEIYEIAAKEMFEPLSTLVDGLDERYVVPYKQVIDGFFECYCTAIRENALYDYEIHEFRKHLWNLFKDSLPDWDNRTYLKLSKIIHTLAFGLPHALWEGEFSFSEEQIKMLKTGAKHSKEDLAGTLLLKEFQRIYQNK